jgi:putative FmdB family regulatory protein
MPLYEYICSNCGEAFSLLRRLADRDDEIECPGCGEQQAQRQFSSFATLKGVSTDACPRAADCPSASPFG